MRPPLYPRADVTSPSGHVCARSARCYLMARTMRPPVGQISFAHTFAMAACPVPQAKIILFFRRANHPYINFIPSQFEGRFANVTDAGRGAMDAMASGTQVVAGRVERFVSDRAACRRTAPKRTVKSCGPDASMVGVKSCGGAESPTGLKRHLPQGDGGMKARYSGASAS